MIGPWSRPWTSWYGECSLSTDNPGETSMESLLGLQWNHSFTVWKWSTTCQQMDTSWAHTHTHTQSAVQDHIRIPQSGWTCRGAAKEGHRFSAQEDRAKTHVTVKTRSMKRLVKPFSTSQILVPLGSITSDTTAEAMKTDTQFPSDQNQDVWLRWWF